MDATISILGFGEAGQTFALAGAWRERARVYDVKTTIPADRSAKYLDYANAGVSGCSGVEAALHASRVVMSLVTADQALAAARAAAPHLTPGTLYFDMNSVAPATKQAAASQVNRHGCTYIDVAVMSPVQSAALAAPLLLAGGESEKAIASLAAFGFSNLRVVGNKVGQAAAIKMIRSVMFKGMEALSAECALAAHRAGVLDEVAESLGPSWSDQSDYRLDRMMVHGLRRAAEMEEAVKTLDALGVAAPMTRATVNWQRRIGALGLNRPGKAVKQKLVQLTESFKS
ncbi:MAG: DUF1932 domain-containing protein [Pseudomonadota bacterium]